MIISRQQWLDVAHKYLEWTFVCPSCHACSILQKAQGHCKKYLCGYCNIQMMKEKEWYSGIKAGKIKIMAGTGLMVIPGSMSGRGWLG